MCIRSIIVALSVVFALGCSKQMEGCGKDVDCKGERICVDAECVDPAKDKKATVKAEGATEDVTPTPPEAPAREAAKSAPPSPPFPSEGPAEEAFPTRDLLTPKLVGKKLEKVRYKTLLVFDVDWDTSKLEKRYRAIKGAFVFMDLFGEERARIGFTIDEPIGPGEPLKTHGLSIDYNEFMDDHNWLVGTDIDDMKLEYEVKQVLEAPEEEAESR